MSDNTEFIVDQRTMTNAHLFKGPVDLVRTGEATDILIEEGGENFYNYVDWLGLTEDPNLVVLSSLNHYYYDDDEMNNFKTVINIKELNQIKQIKSFLHSCLHFLHHKSNFIGCFIDNKKVNGYEIRNNKSSNDNIRNSEAIENGIFSRIPFINMLYSIMDSKTNTYMSRSSTSLLLEDYGFKTIDMSDLNGITFSHSQKVWATYKN